MPALPEMYHYESVGFPDDVAVCKIQQTEQITDIALFRISSLSFVYSIEDDSVVPD
jgi:hypothetical protein